MQLGHEILQAGCVRAQLGGDPQVVVVGELPHVDRRVHLEQPHVQQRAGEPVAEGRGGGPHVVEVAAEGSADGGDTADTGVQQRAHPGLGVGRREGVVRVVHDRGDAGVQRRERRGEGAGVDVVRAVARAVPEGGQPEVAAEVHGRCQPAELPLPGVDVRVDEARDGDHAVRLQDGAATGPLAEIGPHGDDPVAGDEDVAAVEVADGGVHAEDGRAADQHAVGTGDGGVPGHVISPCWTGLRRARSRSGRRSWGRRGA